MILRHNIFTSNYTFTILGGITKRRGVVDVFKNSQIRMMIYNCFRSLRIIDRFQSKNNIIAANEQKD